MKRYFINSNNLSEAIIRVRIITLDAIAEVKTYDGIIPPGETEPIHYIAVESLLLTDEQIISSLSSTPTPSELSEYQSTLDTLSNIEATSNPTNAQVVAAVKYIARTLRLLIKFFVKYYR